jgi:hypothetical protein
VSADPKAKAEVTEELCRLILHLALDAMIEAKALWFESPVEQSWYHADYSAKLSDFQVAELDYVAARRDLIRWGVVR